MSDDYPGTSGTLGHRLHQYMGMVEEKAKELIAEQDGSPVLSAEKRREENLRLARSRALDLADRVRQDHLWIYGALKSWRGNEPLWVRRDGRHFTDSIVDAFVKCKDGCSKIVTADPWESIGGYCLAGDK